MTSEEISQNIASSTSIPKLINTGDKKHDLTHLAGPTTFLICRDKLENGEYDHPYDAYYTVQGKDVNPYAEAEKKWKADKCKLIFNIHALNEGLKRFLIMEPDNILTRELLFSATRVMVPDGIKGFKAIVEWLETSVSHILDKWIKYYKINPSGVGRLRMRRNTRNQPPVHSSYDIDISINEWGNASYNTYKTYQSIYIPESVKAEIRGEEDSETKMEILKDFIMDNYETEDAEWGDTNYSDEEATGNEIEDDNTEYETILEDILT